MEMVKYLVRFEDGTCIRVLKVCWGGANMYEVQTIKRAELVNRNIVRNFNLAIEAAEEEVKEYSKHSRVKE